MIDPTFLLVALADLDGSPTGTDITDQLASADCTVRLNEEGDGGLTVPYGETITPDPIGKAVVASFDGSNAATVIVEGRRDVEVARGEEAEMVTEYYGRGIGSLLDRYRCAPTLGAERQPSANTRTFSFASPEYDPALWGTATEYGTLLDDTALWDGLPAAFPAFDVQRIGPSEGDDGSAPQGYWYTRQDFTVDVAALHRFFVAADNAADVYIDGFQLGRIDAGSDTTRGFTKATGYTVFLDPGVHTVAARVVNVPMGGGDPGYGAGIELVGNPTFFMLAGYTAESSGRLLTRVIETDASWKLLSYPDDPPGLTDAEVVELLVAEGNAAGVTPQFSVTVHGTHEPRESITLDVGQSLLEHLRDRADGTFLDWSVPPDNRVLHIWTPGDLGSDSGVVYSTANGNLERLESTLLDADVTGLWVSYGKGSWTFVGTHDKASSLRTQAATVGEAKALAQAVLDRDPQPEQVTVDIAPSTGDVPGVDVIPGDTVTAGSFEDERCIGWSMQWTAQGTEEPQFDLELKNRIRGDDERLRLMVQRAAPGQMGGTAPSSPAQDPPEFGMELDAHDLKFQALKENGVYVTGASDVTRSSMSSNLYAVAAEATTAASTNTTFQYLVDGVDALGGAGVLPAGELFVLVPVDPIEWVVANVSQLQANLTAIGTGLEGFVLTPRFV